MAIRNSMLLGTMLVLLVIGMPVQSAFRCGQSVVDRGLVFIEVLERCGTPIFQYSRPTYLVPGVLVLVDEWVYEPGSTRFRRLLTFENGRLVKIEKRSRPIRSAEQLKSEQ